MSNTKTPGAFANFSPREREAILRAGAKIRAHQKGNKSPKSKHRWISYDDKTGKWKAVIKHPTTGKTISCGMRWEIADAKNLQLDKIIELGLSPGILNKV